MEIRIDSDLKVETRQGEPLPIVFVPDVNLQELQEDSIIEAF
jgi:hypothetical protein